MGYRPVLGWLLFIAVFQAFPQAFPQDKGMETLRMATNAVEGSFSVDQRLWFSVPSGDRLVLRVDDREIYRGQGPTSILLNAEPDMEREYAVQAQRRTPFPEDRLLESQSFHVTIDHKAPNPPSFSTRRGDDGFWYLIAEAETTIVALVNTGAKTYLEKKLPRSLRISEGQISLIAWTVDPAGNSSEYVPFHLEPMVFQVENPVPGVWANAQTLVINSRGRGEILWTDNGSDPLDGNGTPYTGPVLIDRSGKVSLRVAFRSIDGRTESVSVSYEVTGSEELPSLRKAELGKVSEETELEIPPGFLWALHGEPKLEGTNGILLRPNRGLRRSVALRLASAQGISRYVFTLDGIPEAEFPGNQGSWIAVESENLDQDPGTGEEETRPGVLRAGSLRTLRWPLNKGAIYYRLNGLGPWLDAQEPQTLPVEGCVVEWAVDRGNTATGPFTLEVPPTETSRLAGLDAPGRRLLYSPYQGDTPDEHTWIPIQIIDSSIALDLDLLDVCDGEDASWRLETSEGVLVSMERMDRFPPLPPVITAPQEASWVTWPFPVRAGVDDVDDETSVFLSVRKSYPSGKESTEVYESSGEFGREEEVPVFVSVEAFAVDPRGNKSSSSKRNFFIDKHAIYISALLSPEDGGDGSREKPYASLEEGLAAGIAKDISTLRISGSAGLSGSVELPSGFHIEGNYDRHWNLTQAVSELSFAPGSSIGLAGGTVEFSKLKLTGTDAALPLILCGKGSQLRIIDAELSGASTLISGQNSSIYMENTLLRLSSSSTLRLPVLGFHDCVTELSAVRLEGSSDHMVGIEARGGSLRLRNSLLDLRSGKTGLGIWLRGVKGKLVETGIHIQAVSYASALEAVDTSIGIQSGSFYVKGRDAVAFSLEAFTGQISGVELRLDSAFVAKAFEVQGSLPSLRDSSFSYTGTAVRSDLISLPASTAVPSGVLGHITGNRIEGFTHLLGSQYGIERLPSFNRLFAGADKPNFLSGDGTPR